MDICKRENKSNYSCYVFDYDNKYIWKKGYDKDDNLYWQIVNYNNDFKNVIKLDVYENDDNYSLIDKLYNEIINSKKDNKDSYYFDDIDEYNNFRLYNSKEDFIHWISDTGIINAEELYILKNEGNYSIVFSSQNPKTKNIKIVFSTQNSKYGNFSEAFRRDFGRTLDIAYDKYDECFNKMNTYAKQYIKKVG